MRSRLLGLVRPGLLGRYGLWHMARWGDVYVVLNEHDRKNGLWVMGAICFRARLVLLCRVFACRTRCKGALGQVHFRGSWAGRQQARAGAAECFAPQLSCAVAIGASG